MAQRRDWKTNPPETKEEGMDCMFDLFKMGTEAANRTYGFGARVERRGNIAAICYPDGTEDLYEIGADLIQ
jgi:hypothetical protein